jgi:hypothetical protein
MLTIDFNSFWSEQTSIKGDCILLMERLFGYADVRVVFDDVTDPESTYSLFFNYPNLELTGFKFYDELATFVTKNELYVVIYDHNAKTRRGFWYDESSEWFNLDGEVEIYINNI